MPKLKALSGEHLPHHRYVAQVVTGREEIGRAWAGGGGNVRRAASRLRPQAGAPRPGPGGPAP
ncbi:hypothetical protein ABZW10_24770, partial [Kitasatospora sp. NPDC004723]|uniref:hypothetical protein n=1 Tax=Kitasatospora sp. NPDC004723 TaxID=3154288 RepID=UPI0033A9F44F